MKTAIRGSRSARWVTVGSLLCVNAIFFWQINHPFIRWASPSMNLLFGLVVSVGLPWMALLAIFFIGTWWSKAIAIGAGIPLVLYSALVLLLEPFAPRAEWLPQAHWNESEVGFYQLNYLPPGRGPGDALLQQQRTVFPGVRLVRNLDLFYGCWKMTVRPTARGVMVTGDSFSCPGTGGQPREYVLKPDVYF